MRALTIVMLLAATASANPRALPYTYTTDTLPAGGVEIEQFADLVPLRARDASTGQVTSYLASQFQTEIEIGLRDRLELGLYFTFVPASEELTSTAVMPEGNGLKQRIRYIFADLGEWPVDVGVYGEVTENEREVELEGKILLQRRFDRLRVAVNLVSEYELYFAQSQRDIVVNPSAGATYEINPTFSVGVDSFLRGEYPQNPAPATRTFGLGPEYYIGPAVMISFGKLWWSVGAYGRVTDIDHTLVPGEVYGKTWFRSMIGYNL